MGKPRLRVRTLMALVATIALAMGTALEVVRYLQWAKYDRAERFMREMADLDDELARRCRDRGESREAEDHIRAAREMREYASHFADMKRPYERRW
jgi:hypothetical protein